MSPAAPLGRRVRIGGVPVDRVTMVEAIDAVSALVASRRGGAVFTPNVDHVIECRDNHALRRAYEAVDLSLADGMPVVWASRALRRGLPEKVSGSDLVPLLVKRAAESGWALLLLGGADGVAPRAAARMRDAHPTLRVVGTLNPRVDMTAAAETRRSLIEEVRAAAPDVILVALGAPKQELFIHEVRDSVAPAVLLGIGASLDFVAGTVRRAPPWMSDNGLEWLFRLSREPTRLWRRYLVRGPRFARILAEDLLRPRH